MSDWHDDEEHYDIPRDIDELLERSKRPTTPVPPPPREHHDVRLRVALERARADSERAMRSVSRLEAELRLARLNEEIT